MRSSTMFQVPRLREFGLYGLASVASLSVDYTVLIALTELCGFHYLASAAIGFIAGSLISYAFCISVVFHTRSVENRRHEGLLFLLIGCLGLVLNQFSMFALVEAAGLPYQLAKVPAAGLSFIFNFSVRKSLLFSVRA